MAQSNLIRRWDSKISRLTEEKEQARTDYRARSKELKEMEKQMEIIQTHITRYNLTPEKEEEINI